MDDVPGKTGSGRTFIPARKLRATVAEALVAARNDFESEPVEKLELKNRGVVNDFHGGAATLSGSREPRYLR